MRRFRSADIDRRLEAEEDEEAKAGRPAFKPTEPQRAKVREMAIAGIQLDQIVLMVRWPAPGDVGDERNGRPISLRTLHEHFDRELLEGKIEANVRVAGALFKAAISGNVSAQVFWLKTQGGWKDVSVGDGGGGGSDKPQGPASGVLVVPGVMDADQWQQITSANQGELMERARKFIESGVVDAEDAVITRG